MDNDGRVSGGGKRKERDAASSRGTYSDTRSHQRGSPSRDAKKARPSSTSTSTSGERRREGDEDDSSATATAILLQSERQIERETLRTIEKIVTRYHCALCRTLALQIGACSRFEFYSFYLFIYTFLNQLIIKQLICDK